MFNKQQRYIQAVPKWVIVFEVQKVLGFKSLRILPTIKKHLFFLDEHFD